MGEQLMLNNRICFFTGNRMHTEIRNSNNCSDLILLKEIIRQLFINAILNGYNNFISGVAMGFDTICAEIVIELKEKYPEVTLEIAIPYETYTVKWNDNDKERFFNIVAKCDKETMLQTRYTIDCNIKRNKYMIKKSDFIVVVNNGKHDYILQMINYAKKLKKRIVCIDPISFKVTEI